MSRSTTNLPSLVDDHAVTPAKEGNTPTRSAVILKKGKEQFKLIFACVCLVAAGVIMAMTMFTGGPSLADLTKYTPCIDAETGKAYPQFVVPSGEIKPYTNPSTGRKTVWPAEACSWTKDGKAKLEPTYVLMNEFIGKEGPTICPDCGRRVVFRNPPPPLALQDEALKAAGRLP